MAAFQKLNMDMLKNCIRIDAEGGYYATMGGYFTHEGGYLYQNGGFVQKLYPYGRNVPGKEYSV